MPEPSKREQPDGELFDKLVFGVGVGHGLTIGQSTNRCTSEPLRECLQGTCCQFLCEKQSESPFRPRTDNVEKIPIPLVSLNLVRGNFSLPIGCNSDGELQGVRQASHSAIHFTSVERK